MKGSYSRVFESVPQIILILFLFGPILFLVGDSIIQLFNDTGLVELALPVGRRLNLLFNSLTLAASVSVTVVLVGVLAGSLLVYEDAVVWRWIKWGFLVTAPVPPYIHALVW